MTNSTPPSNQSILSNGLNWSRQCLHDLLKDFPDDKMLFRSTPADCHALWILGHIALSDAWVLSMITGNENPMGEAFGKAFGYQTDLTEDADDYPAFAEVQTALDEQRQRLLDWVNTATDEQLHAPLDDGGIGFANSPFEAIHKEIWHEGWHSGQLSTLRRALGLGPAFAAG